MVKNDFFDRCKKNTMRFYLLQIIKGFFKVFLKNYISYKKKDKIEITEII